MLKIETWISNDILRKIAEDVKTEELNKYIKLGKEMLKYIRDPENSSVWLAAPQIWHSKRLIVVSLLKDREDENFSTFIMVNPVILEHSELTWIENEWCLSVPGERWKVERWTEIKVQFIDKNLKEQKFILKWLQARIVLHEIDHLNWVLFVDKIVTKEKRLIF